MIRWRKLCQVISRALFRPITQMRTSPKFLNSNQFCGTIWYNFHHLLLFFLPRLKSSNSIKSRAPFPLLALSFTPQSMFIFVILYFKIITTVEPCNFHRIFSLCGKIFCVHNQKIELGVKERAFSNLHRICWPQTHKSLVGVHSSQTVNIYTVEIVHLRS